MNDTIASSRLLTPRQVAELTGFATQTLAKFRCQRSDFLPFVKLGASIRYPEEQVLAYLAGLKRQRSTADGAE